MQYSILALYGTNGFTEQHRQAIEGWTELKPTFAEVPAGREVILFFDGDQAGKEAVEDIAGKLRNINEKVKVSVVETPKGEDVNSLLQGHDPEIFTYLLESRKSFSFYSQGREIASLSSTESSFENQNRNGSVVEPGENKIQVKTSIEKKKDEDSSQPDPPAENALKVTADYIRYETDQMEITLWGGIDINTVSRLRATLHMQLTGNNYVSFRDTADLLGGRSGGGGSNGGGDSNPSSSGNSENGENYWDDATWIQPPRQQSINLSNPNFATTNGGDDSNPLYLNKVDDVIAALGITARNINKYQIIPLKDLYSVLSTQQIANIENLSSGLKTVGTYAAVLNGAIIAFSFTQIEDKYLGDWAKFVTGEVFTLASVIIPPIGIPASLGHGFGIYDQVFDFINLWDMSRKGELFKGVDAKSIPGIPRY